MIRWILFKQGKYRSLRATTAILRFVRISISIRRVWSGGIWQGLFDECSQMALYRLMNHGVIARLGRPIRQGKESLLAHGVAPDGRERAVKIHTSKAFGKSEGKHDPFADLGYLHPNS